MVVFEFKQLSGLRFSSVFSILLIILCLQILTFHNVFSITNEATNYTNESSVNSTKKIFVDKDKNINDTISVGQNQNINKEQKISIVVIAIQKNIYIMEWFFRQMILYIFL